MVFDDIFERSYKYNVSVSKSCTDRELFYNYIIKYLHYNSVLICLTYMLIYIHI